MSDFAVQVIYLCSWLAIPLVLEIIPEIYSAISLFVLKKHPTSIRMFPKSLGFVSVIVPVFNSAETLRACLRSIYKSKYPYELMEIFVVDNKSTDNSFEVFQECKKEFRELNMVWLISSAGKANALNRALYETRGKYVIGIDSDGVLHRKAILNMVAEFERDSSVHCLSGVVLINPDTVAKSGKLLQQLELFEYCQTFLAGRNLASKRGEVYTTAGAFTGFRRSSLLKFGVYNTKTVCEDTDITFALREKFPDGIRLCEAAFFFTEPVENIDALYTQRKRWQKGELEVAYLYLRKSLKLPLTFLWDFRVRLLFLDHTFAFTRMVWGAVMIGLLFLEHGISSFVISACIMYACYVLINIGYYILSLEFLKQLKWYRNIYRKKFLYVFLMPLYSIMLFWMRLAGFFMQTFKGEFWKGENISQELGRVKSIILCDFEPLRKLIIKLKLEINNN